MERAPETSEQLLLFDVRQYLGRTATIIGNVIYVEFGESTLQYDQDSFPEFDDIA